MLPSWVEEFETLQQYLRCLFDSFDIIEISRLKEASLEPLVGDTVQLLISYGRKIMQLSEQSTYKHRNQHYLSRKEVEEEISIIYRNIVGEEAPQKYEKMIRAIIQKLQEERQSIWAKFSMPESRIIHSSDIKSQQKKEMTLEQDKSTNVRNSKAKSRVSRVSTVKEVLQIKNYFEGEENALREFFAKMNKIMDIHKVPIANLEPQFLKFSRKIDENSSEKIIDLIKATTETHTANINNLSSLAEMLHEFLNRKLKNEGFAESKLSLYLEEVQRMEEVYSYTLSKMLEKLAVAKQSLEEDDATLCSSQLESLEEVTRKLYGLYPSQQSFKSLAVKVRANEGTKNYGVQINMGKAQQDRKTGTEAFRLQVRVNECIQRFEKSSKFRKSVELKQLQRLFETLREILPAKSAKTEAEVAYQEEFKNLLQMQEKKEKEILESSAKKLRKAQKRVQQLEIALEQLKKQAGSVNDDWQQERKKLHKRIEAEQNELRKLAKEKASLDSNLSQYISEIEKMREEVRRKGDEQTKLRKLLERQCNELRDNLEISTKKLKQTTDQYRSEKEKIGQERNIYHNKIEMTENQLEDERELSAGFRVELEASLNDNRKLREQLSEMSKTYEEKIKELDEMIENVRELHQIKHKQELSIQELEANARQHAIKLENAQKELGTRSNQIEELVKEKNNLLQEVQHWKEEGKLTDSDLKVLKDEVEKVSRAYIDSEENQELIRHELSQCTEEREKLFREKLKLNRLVEDLQGQITSLRTKLQANELAQRDMKEEYYQNSQQLKRNLKELQELKKEIAKIRKELLSERQDRAKGEKELRELRQQYQGRRQSDSLEQGKRRMQLENLRVQLRKKSQQLQKQKESYEQKLSLTHQKMKELQQFSGQKQLLSRLMQNHQTQ